MEVLVKNHLTINTHIGKSAIYFCDKYCDGFVLNFTSDIDQVGRSVDRDIANNSKIIILSDPKEAQHPILGSHFVTKILAPDGQCMWVSTCFIGLI